jgi:protein-S-isoprenylcysteine O-methyltransferase Ste14
MDTAAPLLLHRPRRNPGNELLLDEFGDEYVGYKKRTWRLAPWVY